ncbi:MAG: DUF4097 family beta strand repeat-containing protein [Balneolaceae bacterium]
MRTLKNFFGGLIIAAGSMAIILSAVPVEAQRSDQAYMIRTFDVSQPELIDVNTSGGFVRVYGSDREDVRVEMFVRRNNRYLDDTDISLDDFEIEIDRRGNTIIAHSKRKSGGWRLWGGNSNISVSFVVYTPRATHLDARTSGGSMVANNLEGDLQLRTSGGSLTLESLAGKIAARTSGGSITVKDSRGEIDTRTSGGSIHVDRAEGNLDFRTSGGSIRLAEITGTVSARTSGGSINAKLMQVGESVDLSTSGGSITIDLPGDMGYDLDLSGNRVRTELRNFSGEVERNRVVGSINNGGPTIRARTSGGTVRINYL